MSGNKLHAAPCVGTGSSCKLLILIKEDDWISDLLHAALFVKLTHCSNHHHKRKCQEVQTNQREDTSGFFLCLDMEI